MSSQRADRLDSIATGVDGVVAPRYGKDQGFHQVLRARVRQYLDTSGLPARGLRTMYVKTAALFLWLAASYVLLVFMAENAWQGVPLAVSLGLAIAGIGFGVQHDGAHGSYSTREGVNRLMARALDLLGGSSFVWQRKHNVLHHTWPNVEGVDDDIDAGSLARLSPGQPRRSFHRIQHIYMWPLYCFLAVKWQLYDDFAIVVRGRMGGRPFPRPRGSDLAVFVGGKLVFFGLAFALPLLLHPVWRVVAVYLLVSAVAGLTLSVVFQLAHCVPEAQTGQELGSWAARQVQSSVDFARDSRLLRWYVGGLNMQIEHHLFPQICHLHYAGMAPRRGHLPGIRCALHRSPDAPRGGRRPLPAAARARPPRLTAARPSGAGRQASMRACAGIEEGSLATVTPTSRRRWSTVIATSVSPTGRKRPRPRTVAGPLIQPMESDQRDGPPAEAVCHSGPARSFLGLVYLTALPQEDRRSSPHLRRGPRSMDERHALAPADLRDREGREDRVHVGARALRVQAGEAEAWVKRILEGR
jgi:linoleoyl-CoA desaturase